MAGCSSEDVFTENLNPPNNRAVMSAYYTNKPIEIDGVLDEIVWQKAESYKLYSTNSQISTRQKLTENGKTLLAWDENYFYVAVEFEDSDILAKGDKDDMPHYKLGDVCEVFLKPAQESFYWEIWATPMGKKTSVFWLERGKKDNGLDNQRKLCITSSAKIHGTLNMPSDKDKGWCCEIRIPMKDLDTKDVNFKTNDWLILVARQNYNCKIDKAHRELSSTPQLIKANFHSSIEYALLKFTK